MTLRRLCPHPRTVIGRMGLTETCWICGAWRTLIVHENGLRGSVAGTLMDFDTFLAIQQDRIKQGRLTRIMRRHARQPKAGKTGQPYAEQGPHQRASSPIQRDYRLNKILYE